MMVRIFPSIAREGGRGVSWAPFLSAEAPGKIYHLYPPWFFEKVNGRHRGSAIARGHNPR
jgi:hypothetical protein